MKYARSRTVLLLVVLVLSSLNIYFYRYARQTQDEFIVAFLDVGQGDAIYIRSPSGIDMLVDGGKDKSVLRELPKVMSPYDRTIDIVVATHPDADHIGGLPEVFSRYTVHDFVYSSLEGDTSYYDRLVDASTHEKDIRTWIVTSARTINLGGGAYAEVLYPDRDIEGGDTNTASIVMRVVYGSTTVMLTGDAPQKVEDWLVKLYGGDLKSDILKVGHHGSKTSSSEGFLQAVAPLYAIISAGRDNSYGHPHAEVLDRIQNLGATLYRTDTDGTIIFESTGGEPKRVE